MRLWKPYVLGLALLLGSPSLYGESAPAHRAEAKALSPWVAPAPAEDEHEARNRELAERTEYAQLVQRLHEDLGRTFAARFCDHFVLLYNTDPQWAVSRGVLLEETFERFYGAFLAAGLRPRPLEEPLLCVLFDQSDDFERYAQMADRMNMSWSRGYYSARTNRMAIFDERGDQASSPPPAEQANHSMSRREGLSTAENRPSLLAASPKNDSALAEDASASSINLAKTTHEAAHQLAFNSGLQTRGVMYPLWVSEGLATNFERDGATGLFGPEHDNPFRRRKLLRARQAHELMPLSEALVLTRVPVHDPHAVSVVYAQAWGLFKFFYQQRPAELARYLHTLARLEPGARDPETLRREVVAAFGPIADLQEQWCQFLDNLEN